MLKAERQAIILQIIAEKGFVKTEELMERLGVSHVTLRRDLIALSEQNLINLEHGGATRIAYLDGIAEPLYDTKLYVHSKEKTAMADVAIGMIRDGDILVLDSGTTNYKLAQKLKASNIRSLTVITSDIMSARELSPHPNISVLVLGGILRKSYFNVYGPFTEQILANLKANRMFLGFDGASVTRGISLNILEEVPVKQKMMSICDEVIAFGDTRKYGKDAPYRICGWEQISHVITDGDPGPDFQSMFLERQIPVKTP